MSQKYTVVCFFEDDPVQNFSALEWPLHVTVLDTFRTAWSLEKLTHKLSEIASIVAPFDNLPTQVAFLGANKDVPVKLLHLDNEMSSFHNLLLGLAQEGSFVFNTPEFDGDGFLPHVTDEKSGVAKIGIKYPLKRMSIVDMPPEGMSHREAAHRIVEELKEAA